MSHLVGVGLIAAWLAFALLAPRLASAEVTSILALVVSRRHQSTMTP